MNRLKSTNNLISESFNCLISECNNSRVSFDITDFRGINTSDVNFSYTVSPLKEFHVNQNVVEDQQSVDEPVEIQDKIAQGEAQIDGTDSETSSTQNDPSTSASLSKQVFCLNDINLVNQEILRINKKNKAQNKHHSGKVSEEFVVCNVERNKTKKARRKTLLTKVKFEFAIFSILK
jgi:hypothetical protein